MRFECSGTFRSRIKSIWKCVWHILGRLWGVLGESLERSRGVLVRPGGALARLGVSWGVLEGPGGVLDAFWGRLGGILGASWWRLGGVSGAFLVRL